MRTDVDSPPGRPLDGQGGRLAAINGRLAMFVEKSDMIPKGGFPSPWRSLIQERPFWLVAEY